MVIGFGEIRPYTPTLIGPFGLFALDVYPNAFTTSTLPVSIRGSGRAGGSLLRGTRRAFINPLSADCLLLIHFPPIKQLLWNTAQPRLFSLLKQCRSDPFLILAELYSLCHYFVFLLYLCASEASSKVGTSFAMNSVKFNDGEKINNDSKIKQTKNKHKQNRYCHLRCSLN